MKKLAHGSARRSLVSVVLVAVATTLGACAPLPKTHDASSAGGGGGATARAGWVVDAPEANAPLAREALTERAPRAERVDLRPPRTGVVYCMRCQ